MNSIYRCNNHYKDIPLILFILTKPLSSITKQMCHTVATPEVSKRQTHTKLGAEFPQHSEKCLDLLLNKTLNYYNLLFFLD